MSITSELWVAYTRIFFVELAYWIVSIGMVFVNQFVLGSNILSDDLTVFVTMFQILFSLSMLVSLNYITKVYFIPDCDNQNNRLQYSNYKTQQKEPIINNEHINNANDDVELDETDRCLQSSSNNNIYDDHNNRVPIESKQVNHGQTREDTLAPPEDSLMSLIYVNFSGRINLDTSKVVFPLSILYIGMLLLNNFCLKYVGVAFYFVSRSLTTVFNVAFTYILMKEPVSRGALACCGLIVFGFILGIDQESVIGSLSVIGIIFGVASSLFTSLFSIYTKKTLTKLDKNIWVLVLYNNLNAIVLCTPLLIVHGDIQALISDKVINPIFWSLLSISGIMAFFISIVTNASIKYTSPLTHNISGTAKACLQTVIAVMYYHDHKSSLWWLSNIIILVASAAYSRIKQLEMEAKSSSISSLNMKQQQGNTYRYNSDSNKFKDDQTFPDEEKIKFHRSESSSSNNSSFDVHFDSGIYKDNYSKSGLEAA